MPELLSAALTALLFGSWFVPTQTIKTDPRALAFWLTAGHLAISTVVYVTYGQAIPIGQTVVPFLMGAVWAIGILLGYKARDEIGIVRGVGTWVAVIIALSVFWGLVAFGESPNPFVLALALLCVAGTVFCVLKSSVTDKMPGSARRGYLYAIVVGIAHGSFYVPLHGSDLPVQATFFPLALGMVMTTLLIAMLSRVRLRYPLTTTARMTLAGIILAGGNYLAVGATVTAYGVALGYPLTQLAIVVSALWGVLVFREVTTRRGRVLIAVSVMLAVTSALLVSVANA